MYTIVLLLIDLIVADDTILIIPRYQFPRGLLIIKRTMNLNDAIKFSL